MNPKMYVMKKFIQTIQSFFSLKEGYAVLPGNI